MDFQMFIVAVIIAAAFLYVGRRMYLKTKSFSSKSSCGIGCGCGTPVSDEKIKKRVEV